MKTKSRKAAKKPKSLARSAAAPSLNGPPPAITDVLTLAEAAAFLRAKENDIRKMAALGAIPAKRVGEEWRFLKSALCEWLSAPNPKPDPNDWRARNERILATFGSMAHDETAIPIMEEIYRERKRHPVSELQD